MSLPPAHTQSAREARFTFYCTLCSKGYQRIHEFEAHENSYDHQHKKRFQEMKAMQKPLYYSSKRSSAVGSADGSSGSIIPIKLLGTGTGDASASAATAAAAAAGVVKKKKGGFKSAFGNAGVVSVLPSEKTKGVVGDGDPEGGAVAAGADGDESTDDEGCYDPARPTGV